MDTRRAVLDIQRTQRLIARAMEDEKQQERIVRPPPSRRDGDGTLRATPPAPPLHVPPPTPSR